VARFVDAVDRALAPRGFHVDRQRVILSGHSGAGCMPGNGILAGVGSPSVQTVLDIDCCMNERIAQILATAPTDQRVIVGYQTHMWSRARHFDSFLETFRRLSHGIDPAQRVVHHYRVHGRDAHNEMVSIVLLDWLPRLVPPMP
jgi:hypothetical protein